MSRFVNLSTFLEVETENSHCSLRLKGRLPQHVRTAATVLNFLGGVPTPDLGISSRAIEAKAAVLWERVAVFVHKWTASSFSSLNKPD